MNFYDIKKRFDDEWIENLCDLLENDNSFTQKNKLHILDSLKHAIEKQLKNVGVNHFNDQRMAYLFVLEKMELEHERLYYNSL